jgi:hypothetical protein
MADIDLEEYADRVEEIIAPLSPEHYHKVLEILAFRRPWRPKRTGWINVLDQTLHVLYAMIIFMPLLAMPSYETAASSGFLLGIIREWEQWKNLDFRLLMFWARLQDAIFFAFGATIIYHLLQ